MVNEKYIVPKFLLGNFFYLGCGGIERGWLTIRNIGDKKEGMSHQVIDLSVSQSSLIDKKFAKYEF
jgi:hypothetical protein